MAGNGDSYTEVTSQSWGSRLMESIKGVLVGLLLFIAAFPVLFMNEGCSVKTAKGLEEGGKAAIHVEIDKAEPGNNGKLVHMTGEAVTDEVLTDPLFNISEKGIRLSRDVEMYQWKEIKEEKKEKKVGGSEQTTTTYKYEKEWSSTRIDSSKFKKPGYNNPAMRFSSDSWQARLVKLGAFRLSSSLISQITSGEKISLDQATFNKLPANVRTGSVLNDGGIYAGKNPSDPQVGDLRISFSLVKPQEVSVLSKQQNNTFEAFRTSQDTEINRVMAGNRSIENMIAEMQKENVMKTWLIRLGGFLMMFIGLGMIFKPISTFGDVVPVVGSILSMGTGVIAFVIALVCSLITIAIAWIVYRPILGIILLLIGGGVFAGIWFYSKQKKAKAAA